MVDHGEELQISGAWIIGFGTIVAALGQTEQTLSGTGMGKDLIIKGNVLEAFGNSLQGIGREKLVQSRAEISEKYSIIGSWIQAGGNTANAVGLGIEQRISEDEGLRLNALGSGVQALGAGFETLGAVYSEASLSRTLDITGNSLFVSGALLESIGSIFIINTKKEIGENLLLVGSWIQVIGALILIQAFDYIG